MEKNIKWIFRLLFLIMVIVFGMCFGIYEYSKPQIFYCGVKNDMIPQYVQEFDSLSIAAENGKILFEANCASCHAIHSVVVGPALVDIEKRRSKKWLYKFIRNPQKMISSGDKYAIKLAEEYKSAGIICGFESLTKKEIDDIIEYCN